MLNAVRRISDAFVEEYRGSTSKIDIALLKRSEDSRPTLEGTLRLAWLYYSGSVGGTPENPDVMSAMKYYKEAMDQDDDAIGFLGVGLIHLLYPEKISDSGNIESLISHGWVLIEQAARSGSEYARRLLAEERAAATSEGSIGQAQNIGSEIGKKAYNNYMDTKKIAIKADVAEFIRPLNEKYELGLSEEDLSTCAEQWALSLVSREREQSKASIRPSALVKAGSVQEPSGGLPLPPIPTNFEEAKVQVPGLIKWNDARDAHHQYTIIDHLRDPDTGYGRWTQKAPGLPRNVLLMLDEPAYRALYKWLPPRTPRTGDARLANKLPDDLYLPRRSDVAREGVVFSGEDAQETARRASLLRRMEANSRGQPSR